MWQWIKSSRALITAAGFTVALLGVEVLHEREYQKGRQHAGNEQRFADRAPSAVAGRQEHPAADRTDAEHKNDEPAWSWRRFWYEINIADATIAIFTIVLGIATWRLWEETKRIRVDATKSIEAAKQSADAALLQARAFVGAEKPILVIDNCQIWRWSQPGEEVRVLPGGNLGEGMMFAILGGSNEGRTTATIEAISWDWHSGAEMLPKPAQPPSYAVDIAVKREKRFEIRCDQRGLAMSDSISGPIHKGEDHVWFYGYVRFRDFMDVLWEQGFLFRWIEARKDGRGPKVGFHPVDNRNFRYLRKHEPEGDDKRGAHGAGSNSRHPSAFGLK